MATGESTHWRLPPNLGDRDGAAAVGRLRAAAAHEPCQLSSSASSRSCCERNAPAHSSRTGARVSSVAAYLVTLPCRQLHWACGCCSDMAAASTGDARDKMQQHAKRCCCMLLLQSASITRAICNQHAASASITLPSCPLASRGPSTPPTHPGSCCCHTILNFDSSLPQKPILKTVSFQGGNNDDCKGKAPPEPQSG